MPNQMVASGRSRFLRRGRRPRQLSLELPPAPQRPGRGGARPHAGRKPRGKQAGVSHAARPSLDPRHPVLVTLKLGRSVPSLRAQRCLGAVRQAFSAGRDRLGFRLVHYAVQPGHVHLIVEVEQDPIRFASRDVRTALSRGLQGLAIRLARSVNRAVGRAGRVFADRYHARALASPRAVRNALRYVLLQSRRHGAQQRVGISTALDPCTSGGCFDGWSRPGWQRAGPWDDTVVRARGWLLRMGWRRHGLIDPQEVPAMRS